MYPIAKSNFTLHDAPALTEANFSSLKNFQAQVDSVTNYTHYVRMSFCDTKTNSVAGILHQNIVSSEKKNQSRNPN